MLRFGGRKTPYLTPYDHAFASGPVFDRPKSLRAARSSFERPDDGELLWRIFERFDQAAVLGESVKLGLNARIISANAAKSVRIGKNCAVRGTIRCEPGGQVEIGDTVYIGDDVIISARSRVTIGDATLIGHGVQIFDNDTHPTDAAEREAHFKAILGLADDTGFNITSAPVTIGRACWLGFASAVMKGVTIGDGAIVAAQAVVVADVPPRSVVAGNPATPTKAGSTNPAESRPA